MAGNSIGIIRAFYLLGVRYVRDSFLPGKVMADLG